MQPITKENRLADIRGLIFDYGGTLDTSGRHWARVMEQAYRDEDIPANEESFRQAYIHAERTLGRTPLIKPDFSFRQTLALKLQLQMEELRRIEAWLPDDEELERKHRAVLDRLYKKVKETTTQSRRILERLGQDRPLVLVSNFYGNLTRVLSEMGLDHLFESVVESAVVGVRKPDPRIFSLGVEALGFKADEVLVVGDSFEKDILPAREVGCRTVWFKGEGWTEETVDSTLPNVIIDRLDQLLPLMSASIPASPLRKPPL